MASIKAIKDVIAITHDREFAFGCATNPWIFPTISTTGVPKIKVSLIDWHVNMSESNHAFETGGNSFL
ncbi:MAG: hypothetical protein ACETWK_06540, partial [Candidatus Aminicenantaceae bacterium]